MRLLNILILIAGLSLAADAHNYPRTDGFYRAQGSGDKVESARVFWIKFTKGIMTLELYNTEGQKLREYFKYSEYKAFHMPYTVGHDFITASDNLHQYQIQLKGNEIHVKTLKGDQVPAKFVFVSEVDANNERKGISKVGSTPSSPQQAVKADDTEKEKTKKKKKRKRRNRD